MEVMVQLSLDSLKASSTISEMMNFVHDLFLR